MSTSLDECKHVEQSDRELLTRYLDTADQQAFAQLVQRYAGLVMGVCRRTTRDSHHADDAFQATFMVFAKNARKVRDADALSSWLHGVAYRTCLRLNRKTMRQWSRNLNEEQMAVTDDPFETLANRFANQKVDEELNILSEQLRTPMVLRYLSGMNNAEIADQLNLSVSAVEGRLKRAKSKLRARLMRHGISAGTVLTALAITREAESAVPKRLIDSTIENSLSFLSAPDSGSHFDSATEQVAQLANEEAIAMSILNSSKLTAFAGAAAVIFAGIGLAPAISTASGAGGHANENQVTSNSNIESVADSVIRVTQSNQSFGLPDSETNPFDETKNNRNINNSTQSVPQTKTASNSNAELRYFDVKKRSGAETAIEKELSKLTKLEFFDTPLSEAIEYLSSLHGLNLVIDNNALDDLAIGTDTVVADRALSGIPLRDAMDLILDELSLTWLPTKNVVLITTSERAQNTMESRVYPISGEWHITAAKLLETIQSQVAPDSWDEVGGKGAISQVGECLVIRQNYRTHEEITELLTQLDAAMTGTTATATRPEKDNTATLTNRR